MVSCVRSMIPTNGLAHEHDYIQRVTASEKKCPTIYSGKRGIKFVFVANRVYDVITNANITWYGLHNSHFNRCTHAAWPLELRPNLDGKSNLIDFGVSAWGTANISASCFCQVVSPDFFFNWKDRFKKERSLIECLRFCFLFLRLLQKFSRGNFLR